MRVCWNELIGLMVTNTVRRYTEQRASGSGRKIGFDRSGGHVFRMDRNELRYTKVEKNPAIIMYESAHATLIADLIMFIYGHI